MKKLLLVDGNSVLFRAYFSTIYTNRMSTSGGIPTNAVFGFITMLQKSIQLSNPDAILVAWDAGKKTFRHDKYEEYKGTRPSLDDELLVQMPIVREYLQAAGIASYEKEGYEADDIIGTVATACEDDWETTILTSDKDLLQLVDPTTRVMLMKRGLQEVDVMDEQAVEDRYGLKPIQIIDLKGLMGDPSDNIPGVKHIGEKTALTLLHKYGSIDNIYDHIDEISGKRKQYLLEGKEMAYLSQELATIFKEMDLPFDLESLAYHQNVEEAASFYHKYEMNSLLEKLRQQRPLPSEGPVNLVIVDHFDGAKNTGLVLLPLATREPFLDQTLFGFLYNVGNEVHYLSVEKAQKDEAFLDLLKTDSTLQAWSIKTMLHLLDRYGFPLAHFAYDIHLALFLLHSQATSTQDQIRAANIVLPTSLHDLSLKKFGGFTEERALPVYAKWCEGLQGLMENELLKQLEAENLMDLYQTIELPLTRILYKMECEGIQISADILSEIGKEYQDRMNEIAQSVYGYAGHEFNIGSPKQLGQVLFDEMKLMSGGRKRSTAAEVLQKMIGTHPIVDEILEYRKYSKLVSTYIEGLMRYIKDGHIYTTFNQTVTTTGRLSSSDPNLQNISVKTDEGKQIRKAFVAPEGYCFLSADYSQIELRLLAHMANEQYMIQAFQEDEDIHNRTASIIFDVPENEVTEQERRVAKTVNFAIIYGQTEFGLSQELGISRFQARQFIQAYMANYPNIHRYMNELIAFCEEHGYVETLLHRRREIPEIKDKNYMTREFGKRAAMNAPIQGSAADLIKIAMVKMDKALEEKHLQSKMILQIHDELIFLVPQEEKEEMEKLIVEIMSQAMELNVPLKASVGVGQSWYEAK
ncbi:MAG: DNA polymerase I [Allobaculum sp.]|nr:DNA polymerase I [Allobaculum sp.]